MEKIKISVLDTIQSQPRYKELKENEHSQEWNPRYMTDINIRRTKIIGGGLDRKENRMKYIQQLMDEFKQIQGGGNTECKKKKEFGNPRYGMWEGMKNQGQKKK